MNVFKQFTFFSLILMSTLISTTSFAFDEEFTSQEVYDFEESENDDSRSLKAKLTMAKIEQLTVCGIEYVPIGLIYAAESVPFVAWIKVAKLSFKLFKITKSDSLKNINGVSLVTAVGTSTVAQGNRIGKAITEEEENGFSKFLVNFGLGGLSVGVDVLINVANGESPLAQTSYLDSNYIASREAKDFFHGEDSTCQALKDRVIQLREVLSNGATE